MRNWVRITLALIVFVVAGQSVAFAQQGFTINDRDGALPQICFRVNVNSGAAVVVGNLVDNTTGLDAVAEYEGLASIGSVLYGVSEYDPALGVPIERANLATISPVPASNPAGGQCRRAIVGQSGDGAGNVLFGTEAGAAWNVGTGFIYNLYGDDLTVGPRGEIMRLYTVSPTTGKAVFVGDVRLGSATGAAIYAEGLAIDNNGVFYASDGRGINGQPDSLYTINITPVADPNNPGNFVVIATRACTLPDTAEDSALAWDFTNSRLFYLLEGNLPGVNPPRLQQLTPAVGACTLGPLLPLTGGGVIAGDYEGFDIPQQTVR